MADRPLKPLFSATLVIRAVTELTLAEKVVWLETYAFDRSSEGAYISAASVAARWGGSLAPKTVELARNRLKRLALHDRRLRPGSKNVYGWFAILPPGYEPRGAKPPSEVIADLARRLDDYIRRVGHPCLESGASDAPTVGRPLPRQSGHHPLDSGTVATAMGGRGAAATLASCCETTLQPQLQKEDGVAAHAAGTEDGEQNPRGETAREEGQRNVQAAKLPSEFADQLARLRKMGGQ